MIMGSKVILRTIREADLDTLFDLMSDIRNRGEYFPRHLRPESLTKKEFRETGFWSKTKGSLLICDLENRIVGQIYFFKEPSYYNGLELGYILYDEESRNQGYVSEAVSLLLDFLYSTKNINRIQVLILSANIASKRVAEKCGFKFEGIARGAVFHNGANRDVEVHSILREEVECGAKNLTAD